MIPPMLRVRKLLRDDCAIGLGLRGRQEPIARFSTLLKGLLVRLCIDKRLLCHDSCGMHWVLVHKRGWCDDELRIRACIHERTVGLNVLALHQGGLGVHKGLWRSLSWVHVHVRRHVHQAVVGVRFSVNVLQEMSGGGQWRHE